MKYLTLTIISITSIYGGYTLGGYIAALLMFLILCVHYTLSYHKQEREEDFHINEEHIPVIGGKKINWEEYREIPPDITPTGRMKFDRNKL